MILEGRLKDMTWDEGDNCKKNQSAVNDEVSGDEIYNDEVYEDEDYTYTTVYEEDWVKEDMIFREKVRIEPKDGREVFFLEGHALSIGGQVIILKSFLVL
mgnify:FL=1